MTACKDSLNGKKAVSATLAGVLAVGMVPAAAFADAAQADTNDEQGIELTSVDSVPAFEQGYVSAYSGTETKTGVAKTAKIELTYKADTVFEVVPTEVTFGNGDKLTSTELANTDKFKIYYTDAAGNVVEQVTEAGDYNVVIEAVDGAYKGGKITRAFSVKAETLSVTGIASVNSEGKTIGTAGTVDKDGKVTGLGVMYNGKTQTFQFSNGNTKLVEGTDYTVKYYKAKTDLTTEVEPKDAGDYVAVLTGAGKYANKAVKVQFSIGKLTAATVAPVLTDSTTSPALDSITVQGQVITDGDLLGALKVEFEQNVTNTTQDYYSANGKYKFTAKAADEKNANIDSAFAAEFDVTKVGKMNAVFKYDGEAWPSTLEQTAKVGYLQGNVAAYEADGTTSLCKLDYTNFTYTNRDGTAGGSADIKAEGGTVTVKAYDATFECGGTATMSVTMNKGTVDGDASVYVTFGGEIVDSIETTYTGSAINPTVKVKKADGIVVTAPDADFKVTYYDAAGKKLDAAPTDAGSYTLKVTSDTYKLANNSDVAITIKPVDLTDVKVADKGTTTFVGGSSETTVADGLVENGSYTYVPASSSKLSALKVIAYSGKDANENEKKDDADYSDITSSTVVNYTWYKYDEKAGEYKIVNAGSTALTAGDYKVVLKGKSAAKSNYAFGEDGQTVVEFSVADEKDCTFKDVAPTDWFFKEVAEASHAKDETTGATSYTTNPYVKGVGDTGYYAPNEGMTRGQVAIVLFRMAGGVDNTVEGKTFPTVFTDVESSAYYAQAIQWASDAGIVTGFDGTTEFRPNDTVTREQFATMLARYAKLKGADIAADEASLADYSDGAQVSDWAKGYVAWAVESGVMGKNTDMLWAGNDVSRAEVAAMAVRYQPRK